METTFPERYLSLNPGGRFDFYPGTRGRNEIRQYCDTKSYNGPVTDTFRIIPHLLGVIIDVYNDYISRDTITTPCAGVKSYNCESSVALYALCSNEWAPYGQLTFFFIQFEE